MTFHPAFFEGQFGMERETLRVDAAGRLAQTPHPFDEPSITRDFCENQLEIITPVCHSVDEMLETMAQYDAHARQVLAQNGERIWLYSNPPHIGDESEIPVANFTGEETNKRRYRELLEHRYGKRLMLYSGIHFNFSFSEDFLHGIHAGAGDYAAWRDAAYLRLYQNLFRHSWLLVLLTAASPWYDRSFDGDGLAGAVRSDYSSLRCSERGYWNEFIPILRHETLRDFCDSIQFYVDKGILFSASEIYLPVRLKPRGVNSLDYLRQGISHIELRMFDLNPLFPLGIDPQDLRFAHLLMLYLFEKPAFAYTPELQAQAVRDHRNAARFDLGGVTIDGKPILERAAEILDEMTRFFDGNENAQDTVQYQRQKLYDRPCEHVTDAIYQ